MKRKQNKSEKSLINYQKHFHLTKKISKYHLKNQISKKTNSKNKMILKKKDINNK